MKIYKKHLKLLFFTIIFVLCLYVLEFYVLLPDLTTKRCLNIINGNFLNFKLKIPIHCDFQYYFNASSSIEYFFSDKNPYQKRPLFVFLQFLISSALSFFTFNYFENLENFRITNLVVQILILYLISLQITKLFKNKNLSNYLLIIVFYLIPNIRWNIFFPSHGSLTLLGALWTLNLMSKKTISNSKNLITTLIGFGIFSLAHRMFMVYGMIFLIFEINKSKNFSKVVFSLLIYIPTYIYEKLIDIFGKTSYDYNVAAYKQFYWIIDKLNKRNTFNHNEFCQEFISFYKCNLNITIDLIKYYWLQIVFTLILFILIKFKKNILHIQNLLLLTLISYLFWSLIGWYPPFRFVNYSIGYFIFILFALTVSSNLKFDYLFIISMIVSLINFEYLGVYDGPNFFDMNIYRIISILIFLGALYLEFGFFKKFNVFKLKSII